jgi:beta-1,4-N-acetylglucosaminyltransferase
LCALAGNCGFGLQKFQNDIMTKNKKEKNVFVTVGTTQFDKLVNAATSDMALQWMRDQGYTSLTVQYGKGAMPAITSLSSSLDVEMYNFRSSLEDDMKKADLILSHAGAGTVMEGLRMNKSMVVVINTDLMNNHQTELADAMAKRGHLCMVSEPDEMKLSKTWKKFESFVPVPHQEGDDFAFPWLLDSFLGFSSLRNKND